MSHLTVDLYQSTTDPSKFLALPSGTDAASLTAPMVFDQDYGSLVRYREGFEFDPDTAYAGVDAAKIAASILTVKWAGYRRDVRSKG